MSHEPHPDTKPDAAWDLRASLTFFPKMLQETTARRLVPYPLFPETWLIPGYVPGGYLAAWCHDEESGESGWGALGFTIWSSYGSRKGLYVSQAVVGDPSVRDQLQGEWPMETALMGLRKSPHPFLLGIDADDTESTGPKMASWSILPYVTGSAPFSFLGVKDGRAHTYSISVQGKWRLAVGDVHGDLRGLFPEPGWRPVLGVQVRKARVAIERPLDVDLKSSECGAPRTLVATAIPS